VLTHYSDRPPPSPPLSPHPPFRRAFSRADTWGYKVTSVAGALEHWVTKTDRDPKKTYVWICALCLNQHRFVKTMTPNELSIEFGARVSAIGHILPMLEPWRAPVYLSRAWCLFELYTAITSGGKVEIDVVLTEEEDASFLDAMNTEGYSCIDAALANIQSENATATVEADLNAIRELVKSTPGGFQTLNTTVRNHLHEWFEARGAVKSARRLNRLSFDGSSKLMSGSKESSGWARASVFGRPSKKDPVVNALSLRRGKDGYMDVSSAPEWMIVGARCSVSQRGFGTVRWVGLVNKHLRVGVELDSPNGLNNGSLPSGITLFRCKPMHGVFVKPTIVTQHKAQPEDEFGFNDSDNRAPAHATKAPSPTSWVIVGARCTVPKRGSGTVRWIGAIGTENRVGVELDSPNGLNDGSMPDGQVLFRCKPLHGVLVKAPRLKQGAANSKRASKGNNKSKSASKTASASKSASGMMHNPIFFSDGHDVIDGVVGSGGVSGEPPLFFSSDDGEHDADGFDEQFLGFGI
jgi:hypothetical protein